MFNLNKYITYINTGNEYSLLIIKKNIILLNNCLYKYYECLLDYYNLGNVNSSEEKKQYVVTELQNIKKITNMLQDIVDSKTICIQKVLESLRKYQDIIKDKINRLNIELIVSYKSNFDELFNFIDENY